ncbi:MAG: globin domain-containing protein [Chloroflexota bacterium]|nr:globin domain-containing protein [Chloroflexota bacterium]
MSPQKIHLVQASFEQVLPIADSVAALFYSRLFELDPGLRSLFNAGMQEQGHKYMALIHLVVANLDRPDTIVPMLQALGRRHAAYGVNDSHYETMSGALLWALAKSLGPSFTPDVREAWAEVYTLLADTMKAAVQPPVLNPVVM